MADQMRSTGVPRRRSAPQIVPRERPDEESDSDDGRRAGGGGVRPNRLPLWQVVALALAAVGALMLALSYASPRARLSARTSSEPGVHKCYPLTDEDRTKLIARQNRAVHRPIAAASKDTQALFDAGLLQAWGFEHEEAAHNFKAALRLDPQCAMCVWGLAYTSGPYPNVVAGQESDQYPTFTRSAAEKAQEHAEAAVRMAAAALERGGGDAGLLKREAELTALMARRFHNAASALRGTADRWYSQERQYAQAMAELAEAHVNDPDVYALAAEAFMNLRPWDYYTPLGNIRPEAARAEELLRRAISLDSNHTLALHLHIHVAEASAPTLGGAGGEEEAWAGRALGSAEALAATGAQQGHLIHMPSHIFVRVGRYSQAVTSNKRAYDFDVVRSTHCIQPYLPEHNVALLVYAASMAGQMHTAEAYSRGVRSLRERVRSKWMSKGFEWTSQPLVLARYGEWRKILELEEPPLGARGVSANGGQQFSQAVYHFARVLALAARAEAHSHRALGVDDRLAYDLASRGVASRLKEVTAEMRLLRAAVAAIPTETPTRPGPALGIYSGHYGALGRIYRAIAEARVTLMLNQTAQALDQLDSAVAVEGGLGYMEPPHLHQPARQCLGLVLLRAGKLEEAEEAYRKDLLQHPGNGWSLTGLLRVAEARGDEAAAAEARERVRAAWEAGGAEVDVKSSCPALARKFRL